MTIVTFSLLIILSNDLAMATTPSFDKLYQSAILVLKYKIDNSSGGDRTNDILTFKEMLAECFPESSHGIFNDNPSYSELKICSGGAYGHYNREKKQALICNKSYELSLELAVTVPIHECYHHLYGKSEYAANYCGELALYTSSKMNLKW